MHTWTVIPTGQQLLANNRHPVTNCDVAVESLKGILTLPFRSPLLHTDAYFRRSSAPALRGRGIFQWGQILYENTKVLKQQAGQMKFIDRTSISEFIEQ